MPRFARVVATGIAHHITQRGNAQRPVFEDDVDRLAYLLLLEVNAMLYDLSIVGFCLMPNHVHLIAVPGRDDSMALAMQQTHGRYAVYLNGRQGNSGHLWQGRFYSCPLGGNHLWSALRYTEMNPVRAGMVRDPVSYDWSSAAQHCGHPARPLPLTLACDLWRDCWNPASWREFLRASPAAEENQAIRVNTHTGRPLAAREFVATLEHRLGRPLVRNGGGRKPRLAPASPQQLTIHEKLGA